MREYPPNSFNVKYFELWLNKTITHTQTSIWGIFFRHDMYTHENRMRKSFLINIINRRVLSRLDNNESNFAEYNLSLMAKHVFF